MTKSFTGYYGVNQQTNSNVHFFENKIESDQQQTYTPPYTPSYVGSTPSYTPPIDPSVPSYQESIYIGNNPVSTPYYGATTNTEIPTFTPTEEKANHCKSHHHIKSKLKKKKHPASHYSVYRFEVMSATLYYGADSNGLADPFVRCFKVQIKDRRKPNEEKYKELFKTHSRSKTLSPSWEHSELVILHNKDRYIDFEVWDKDLIGSDYMGGVRIDIGNPDYFYSSSCRSLTLTDENGKKIGTIEAGITREEIEEEDLGRY